jgi:LytS/YehU family sensor histidine kinase
MVSARVKGVLFATGLTLGLMLQGGLFGYYLGGWGTIASVALGILEGRWACRYLLRRARIQQ